MTKQLQTVVVKRLHSHMHTETMDIADDVFFFRQQNSLFRQLSPHFFAKWGLFFAKWDLFFANFFDHARVLYSEPSALDRSKSR